MAEEISGVEQQNIQVVVDERDLRTIFTNAYRLYNTADEVILDLGFTMPNPNSQQGQQQILWKISERVVMSYVNAKRLALSLGQLIKRHEQQFGELNVQRQQQPPLPPR